MNSNLRRALQYIKNTGGNCPVNAFLEDHEPIGQRLLDDLRQYPERLWTLNTSGHMVLTPAGENAISEAA